MEPATLTTTEAQALEAENFRLRTALENIRDTASMMGATAKNPTAAAGFAYLGGVANEALENA